MSRRETVSRISVYEKPRKISSTRTPTKKFNTRAEELCDWMNSVGYKVPKHVKQEHFDYIFQHDDTAKIARQLMKLVKPGNSLSTQELIAFEQLKSEGRVLYGADLEAAFNRQKKLELEKAQKNESVIAKSHELDGLIADKAAEIAHLQNIDAVLGQQIQQWNNQEDIRTAREEFERLLAEQYDLEVQRGQDRVVNLNAVLQERLKQIHATFASGTDAKKPVHLCDMEWMKTVEDEEILNGIIKGMFDQYGSDLLRQDFGADNDALDPLEAEAMYRTFKQHEKHLERLKHLIIFEKVREIQMDIQIAGIQAVLKDMEKITDEAKMIHNAGGHIQDRMLREIQQRSETCEAVLKKEKSAYIESVKTEEACRRNTEVKGLVDQRSFAKKKQHEFISFLVNILVHQRVRMDVIRELLRAERTKNMRFSRTLQEFRNTLIDLAQKEEYMHKELQGIPSAPDPELQELLHKYRIPISIYQNPLTTYQALLAVRKCQQDKESARERKEEMELAFKIKNACDRAAHLQKLLEDLKQKALSTSPVDATIAELEGLHKEMREKFEWHESNKHRIAEESKAMKLAKLREIEEMLSSSPKGGHHANSP